MVDANAIIATYATHQQAEARERQAIRVPSGRTTKLAACDYQVISKTPGVSTPSEERES